MSRFLSYFLSLVQSLFKTRKLIATPVHIQLEPGNLCNLHCLSCPRDIYMEERKAVNMSFEQYRKIIEKVNPTHVTLSGLGEPTLNKEIFDMIRYSRQRDININSTFNFANITKKLIDQLLTTDLNLLHISLDAAKPETYEKVRLKDKFNHIVEHIKYLVDQKKKNNLKQPQIKLAFVIQKANIDEMFDFYALARMLEVDGILFQVFSDSALEEKQSLITGVDLNQLEDNINRLIELEKQNPEFISNGAILKDKVSIITSLYSGNKVNLVNRCIKPWVSIYLTAEGDVRPCCSFGANPEVDMGNIFQDELKSIILNNKKYQAFRTKLNKGHVPHPICASCIPESIYDLAKSFKWKSG